ncbi:MAG: acyl carrier protein [Deltaproteobacteria bacterium]|nr:acyl carrier protein [Deltaproteobacteria bacterium]MBW1847396.1 acyl carrier protein [Deltaproteobacteria bacterium]MBW2363837.1 acyl carrier protein [Deltaproteobacteria bacterium]
MGELKVDKLILMQIIKIIKLATGLDDIDDINEHTPLTGSGLSLDSVAVLEILLELEKKFHIEVDAEELLDKGALQNINTLSNFIESKIKQAP